MIDETVIVTDSIRRRYLLGGVDVNHDDTELMIGHDTLEFENYDF